MAGFGEDVSMGDFRSPQVEEDPDAGAGHTSDGSVLTVGSTPMGVGGGGGRAGAFGTGGGVTSSRRGDKVPCFLSLAA